jgi:protein-tyrosine-phosphatase
MSNIKSILFVCTGNSCRSVMAEGLMRKRLAELGKGNIKVSSAGIVAMNGFPPTDETARVMKEEGVDVTNHLSKKLNEEIVKEADLILVMEEIHREFIDTTYPEGSFKTFLLKEYGVNDDLNFPGSRGVSDPIGRSIEFYRLSMEIIKDQVDRIAKLV